MFSKFEIKHSKIKISKIRKKLEKFSEIDVEKPKEWQNDRFEDSLGSIGGGNHFAEIQRIEEIIDKEIFTKYNLDKAMTYLLVHTGSRGLGEVILRKHTDKFKSESLIVGSEDCNAYLEEHNYALLWAELNRSLITNKFEEVLNSKSHKILDLTHNSLLFDNDLDGFIHRKGVSPSSNGLAIIPGSRGHFSYLVLPIGDQKENLFSIAHGAGRKWKRGEVKSREALPHPASLNRSNRIHI